MVATFTTSVSEIAKLHHVRRHVSYQATRDLLFSTSRDELVVTSSHGRTVLRISMRSSGKCDSEEYTFWVPALHLDAFLSLCEGHTDPCNTVVLEFDSKWNRLTLESEGVTMIFPLGDQEGKDMHQDPLDHRLPEAHEKEIPLILEGHDFVSTVFDMLKFVSSDPERTVIRPLHVEYKSNVLEIVACDGHRMLVCTADVESDREDATYDIDPADLNLIDLRDLLEIQIAKSCVKFSCVDYDLFTPLMGTGYVPWRKLINEWKDDGDARIVLYPSDLVPAACSLMKTRSESKKGCCIEVTEDKLELFREPYDNFAEVRCTVHGTYVFSAKGHAMLRVMLDTRYLIDTLQFMDGGFSFQMSINGSFDPVRIRHERGGMSCLHFIMPMKT